MLGLAASGLLLSALVVISGFGKREVAPIQGPLFFDPPTIELGQLSQAEVINREFRLINRSEKKIRLVRVSTSCGCTVLPESLLGKELEPSESIVIPVEYQSGFADGSLTANVQVTGLSQGEKYEAHARIRGMVAPDFSIEPEHLNFGHLKPGAEATRLATFQPKACKELTILAARANDTNFTISLPSGGITATGAVAQIPVTFRAPHSPHRQNFTATLTFVTSCQRRTNATLVASAAVTPDVDITPAVLIFPSERVTGESRLTIRTAHPSSLVRLIGKTERHPKEIPYVMESSGSVEKWQLQHNCRVLNEGLAGVEHIVAELEIRDGAGRTEARSASVQIKRL